MKILEKYILKSFLSPFFATFLIVLFVLVMQALWQTFDQIAGKGISLVFILKFLYYIILIMIPQALPIGVLLSSIMALGNLGENYEFAAAKSAGVSLQRLVRPLVTLAIVMSVINFLFLNNIYPYAFLKQQNLYSNIKKKKPAMALIAGSFNSEIPNYQIKFDEKYGEEQNLLKNVLIYDLTSGKGNQKTITAERGKLISEEGSRYMTLLLYNGHYYENHVRNTRIHKSRMPASSADFDEYEFNIDISSLVEGSLDTLRYTELPKMLSVQQIKDTLSPLNKRYHEYVLLKAKNLYTNIDAKKLYKYPDSLKTKKVDTFLLDNFNLQQKLTILNTAITKTTRTLKSLESSKKSFKRRQRTVNMYEIEFHNRIAFSLSCLILFFIGAPLGSIIRKGGFGLPMILAIAIYVTYFFANTFGQNLAEDSSVSPLVGSWIAAFIMGPIAILLTWRATRDKGIFQIDVFIQPVINLFKRLNFKKTEKHDTTKTQ